MNKSFLTEACGWYGVAALLGAYALLSFGVFLPGNIWFQVLNITGSAGILIDAWAQKNWQPAVLNIVWGIIGLAALIKMLS